MAFPVTRKESGVEEVIPQSNYEFDETQTAIAYNVGYSPSGGTSIYLGVESTNPSTGKRVNAGIAVDLTQAAKGNFKGSASVGIGDMRVGLMSDGSPHVGIGGASYSPGKGIGIGIFTVGSRGIPQVSLESAAIMAGLSVIDGVIRGKRGTVILSETTPKILPVNTAREFISFLRFAWGKSSGPSKHYSPSEIKKAKAFLKSAENQDMVYSALIHLDEMIASVDDPYLAAILMERRDYFITQTSRYLPIGSRFDEKFKTQAGAIEARIEKSVERSEAFTQKYAAWIEGETSESPNDREINTYMMDILYLSQKLAMEVKKDTKDGKTRFKITASSPFSIESPELMSRYLKTVSMAYRVFENPKSGIMSHLAKTIVDANIQFISQIKDPKTPTETALESKEKIDSAFSWITHMQQMVHFYPMRQNYCLWRASKEKNNERRLAQQALITSISVPSEKTISSGRHSFMLRPAITAAITHNSIIAKAIDTLTSVEDMRTQQPLEDLVDLVIHATDVVSRGFDFTSVIDEHRSLRNESAQIFNLLKHYRALRANGWPKTDREHNDFELFRTIFMRAENSFKEAAKKRPEELSREISRMSGDLQDKKEEWEMFARGTYADMKGMQAELTLFRTSIETDSHPVSEFAETISAIDTLLGPALSNFSQLKTIISSIRTYGWRSLSQIVDMDIEDTGRMSIILQSAHTRLLETKEIVAEIRSQLETLRDETATGDEKEKIEDTLDRLSDFENRLEIVLKDVIRLNTYTNDFFSHRAGAALIISIKAKT